MPLAGASEPQCPACASDPIVPAEHIIVSGGVVYRGAPACSTTSAIVVSNCAKLIGLLTNRSPASSARRSSAGVVCPLSMTIGVVHPVYPDGLGDVEPRQSRHEEIGEHGLMNERVEARQPLAPVRHEVRLMTQQLEKLCQKIPEQRLIIDHEHSQFVRSSHVRRGHYRKEDSAAGSLYVPRWTLVHQSQEGFTAEDTAIARRRPRNQSSTLPETGERQCPLCRTSGATLLVVRPLFT